MARPEGVDQANHAQIGLRRDRWIEARSSNGRDLSRAAGILIEIAGRLVPDESSEEQDEHNGRLREGLD